ncbi:TadE family type IV pilus minor pilin [Streptomyces sp. KLOTTS4A1]|uniref:TadE family type IV pilus minor pilin n=1 Tax=Streptomyces sp. KLOTTS4A1 TaxID=3390996 RepID=UPI0039F4CC88
MDSSEGCTGDALRDEARRGEQRRGEQRQDEGCVTADGGFVTAEAACVIPVLMLVGLGLVWALVSAIVQIQCVDAARAGARAAARQEAAADVAQAARRSAPGGAEVTVAREDDLVRVTVSATSPGPDALSLSLRASAVALAEETVGVTG